MASNKIEAPTKVAMGSDSRPNERGRLPEKAFNSTTYTATRTNNRGNTVKTKKYTNSGS